MSEIKAPLETGSAPNGYDKPILMWLDQHFQISARGSSIRTEFLAALTTFATMSYVLAVHPMIMSDAGMDRAAVITVTALMAGIFSILMGLMANLPFVQAPGMGVNAVFTYTIVLGMGVPWEAALGLVFWSGVFFFLLSISGIRRLLLEAFPDSMKYALTAGIGLFLMFIGLKGAGVVVAAPPPTLLTIGDVANPAVLMSLVGVALIMALMAKKVPGAILLVVAILTTVGFFIPLGDSVVTPSPTAIVANPAPFTDLFLALDISYLWTNFQSAFPILLSLIFIDLFSSLASMNAMSRRAGLVDEHNNMLKPTQALSADALATIGAGLAGTSTTNCYGESAAGIESGGRTGLVAVFVGIFFFFALFLNPLLLIIPVQATAPALIFIGLLMFTETGKIDFTDLVIAGSATLTLILMAVTSISDGLAIGLIIYIVSMILAGRRTQVQPIAYILGACFVAYYYLLM